jgi:hypothetical protein
MVGVPARFRLSELPLWRKVLIVLAMGLFFFVGAKLFNKEVEIYTSAPAAPVAATRQISPVHVNHGYVRYVTPEAAENLASWRAAGPSIVALALMLVGALLLTYRGDRRTRNG